MKKLQFLYVNKVALWLSMENSGNIVILNLNVGLFLLRIFPRYFILSFQEDYMKKGVCVCVHVCVQLCASVGFFSNGKLSFLVAGINLGLNIFSAWSDLKSSE